MSNYVQKTDYASVNNAGVVKVSPLQGTGINSGKLVIISAQDATVKSGTDLNLPIVSGKQHASTFYGLAKAAGDTTQSQSSNAVGIYTDEAKAAIQQMLDVPSTGDIPDTSIYATKESIDNAGITDRTYVTKYDGSITTALDSTYESPWCELPNVDGGFACMVYRVTFDNVIYELRAGLFIKYYNKAAKGVEFIGDLSMYIDPTGCLYEVYDVPFCIIDNVADYADGLLVFSKTAGEHTLKLELELLNYNKLPTELIYGKSEPPILWKHNSSSSYFGVSVGSGSNILENTRNVIAVGSGNKISAANGHAYGVDNVISGLRSIAIGLRNNTTGQDNYAFGYNCSTSNEGSLAIGYQTQSSGGYGSIATGYVTTASGIFSHSEGSNSIASGSASHAENMLTTASGSNSHAEGWRTIANHRSQHVFGQANVADPSTAAVTALGTYAEIVGNGTADNARSNAYALTWTGDGHYAGDVYVHANADSSGGTKLATIEDVGVQDVQVNGTSVVTDGVANLPLASSKKAGLLYTYASLGLRFDTVGTNKSLAVNSATEASIKTGANIYTPVAPNYQHISTFYGLAKAAGADEKDSTLPVGTYTDTAKSAIRTMLGAASDNIIAISDTAPTDPDTKVWIPETATSVQVPTVSEMETALAGKVGDVQVNNVSIVGNDGVANIPIASPSNFGVVMSASGYGTKMQSNGVLSTAPATDAQVKKGVLEYNVIGPLRQHLATFYGLSKAAGVDLAKETVTLGTYPEASKTAIKAMLGVEEGLKVVRLI